MVTLGMVAVHTDTSHWPDIVADAYTDPHPHVKWLNRGQWIRRDYLDDWRYGNAVLSIVFDSLDRGYTDASALPPFCGDIANALNKAGLKTARGYRWTGDNLKDLIYRRRLDPVVIGYRTADNLAYVSRVRETGKRTITRCKTPSPV